MRIHEAARGYLKISAFQRVVSIVLLATFGTQSIAWAGQEPDGRPEEVLKNVVTRYDQSRSLADFLKGHRGLMTKEDMAFLKKHIGSFSKIKLNIGVGLRGGNLVIISRGTEKMTLAIDSLRDSTFKINGKPWQANPFQSVEANYNSLQKMLSIKEHSLLERFWDSIVPSSHAVLGFDDGAVIAIAIILVVGGLGWYYFQKSGFLRIECKNTDKDGNPVKDAEGNPGYKLSVKWQNNMFSDRNLTVDPSDPKKPTVNRAAAGAQEESQLCSLDENWNASSACPEEIKKVAPHMPSLKKVLSACPDEGRMKALNDYLAKNKPVSAGKVEKVIDETGAAQAPK